MVRAEFAEFREALEQKKQELSARLERIHANLRRGYEQDSKERAKQLEDNEVVDALGNEAREELSKISAALQRIDAGEYGTCVECGLPIHEGRLAVYPYADECIECAEFDERRKRHS
ncbi:MAG: TraR/DksA family transcriptional regulator [Gammaproteobacteria bacterium]|nr:TraR/DksA family transcriptional regulator [Gammaproteobacteria bacterium]NNF50758.1 TraR/DksA family transcriptional regulator [Woeseiaceae bacterium]MBT8094385.1 TraR/DksA family transcriptional regulator [Gammaproteobacteria bacterium]MBT8104979.1 TraR/DksA family transcriptional regulator [Gammaproteobacteria bacterium]NNK24993.1 TraR/DksA family transcriptional regulator [Woeseiaceae bacterium]